jgi:hypothetical protein
MSHSKNKKIIQRPVRRTHEYREKIERWIIFTDTSTVLIVVTQDVEGRVYICTYTYSLECDSKLQSSAATVSVKSTCLYNYIN